MSAFEITNSILHGNFTAEEIRALSNAVSFKFKEMQRRAAVSFSKGDKVTFTTRNGEKVTGTVARVNQKTVTVNTTTSQWKVSASLLRRV